MNLSYLYHEQRKIGEWTKSVYGALFIGGCSIPFKATFKLVTMLFAPFVIPWSGQHIHVLFVKELSGGSSHKIYQFNLSCPIR